MGQTSVLRRLFRPPQARIAGEALYAGLVDQARRPALYHDLGVPDRIDARFELYVLHLSLLLARLKGEGEAAAEIDGEAEQGGGANQDDDRSHRAEQVPGKEALVVEAGRGDRGPQVLDRARDALRRSRSSGRNQLHVHDGTSRQPVRLT